MKTCDEQFKLRIVQQQFDNSKESENLFGIFKREWTKDKYQTLKELKLDVDDFVHNYNNFRLHLKLKYKSIA